jgi:hypothetical protein
MKFPAPRVHLKGTRPSALFDAAQLVVERSFHARGAALATRDAADVGAVHRKLASDARAQPAVILGHQ